MLAFDREVETLPILSGELELNEVLAIRARRAVALRVEMTPEQRYEMLEMLGLVGDEEKV